MHNISHFIEVLSKELVDALRADRAIYALMFFYLAIAACYIWVRGGLPVMDFGIYALACLATCCIVLPYALMVMAIARVTHRLPQRRRLAFRHILSARSVARLLAGTLLILATLLLFEQTFTLVKTVFSKADFAYDHLAADVDRYLHGGRAPFRYLYSFAKNGELLRLIEVNYHEVWAFLWLAALYWVAVSPRADRIRVRYFITFLLVWIGVGNVVAGIFTSAGPAFYGLVTGDAHRFADLRTFLQSASESTTPTQQYLWSLHARGVTGVASGISAFPSMHVAMAGMNAMFLAERHWRLGLLGALYTLVIMFSSVYLGWHYAIDGYAALILTGAIYAAVRFGPRLVARRSRDSRPAAPVAAPAALVAVTTPGGGRGRSHALERDAF